ATAAVGLAMKPVGEPDAGNLHVRFDERGGETERWPMAPSHRASPRLYPYKRAALFRQLQQIQQRPVDRRRSARTSLALQPHAHGIERPHGRLHAIIDARARLDHDAAAHQDRGTRYLDPREAKPVAGAGVRAAAEHWKLVGAGRDRAPALGPEAIAIGIELRHEIDQKRV